MHLQIMLVEQAHTLSCNHMPRWDVFHRTHEPVHHMAFLGTGAVRARRRAVRTALPRLGKTVRCKPQGPRNRKVVPQLDTPNGWWEDLGSII